MTTFDELGLAKWVVKQTGKLGEKLWALRIVVKTLNFVFEQSFKVSKLRHPSKRIVSPKFLPAKISLEPLKLDLVKLSHSPYRYCRNLAKIRVVILH